MLLTPARIQNFAKKKIIIIKQTKLRIPVKAPTYTRLILLGLDLLVLPTQPSARQRYSPDQIAERDWEGKQKARCAEWEFIC